MFNPMLTVFTCVADCGSFTKAAESLFISPTAVMKQINSLEKHLNMKLLNRTSHGVRLTPAGEVIYRDAKFLFEYLLKFDYKLLGITNLSYLDNELKFFDAYFSFSK